MENKKFVFNKQSDYEKEIFKKDCAQFSAASVATGYSNIDAMTSLYPGLYVIGAVTSLGKTTFIHQMCDQLAKYYEKHILYFSLEMSKRELTAKSLARIMFQNKYVNSMTALDIMKHCNDENVNYIESVDRAILDHYYSDKINIIDNSYGLSIKDIEDCVDDFINEMKVKPIVVIDYLQIISPEKSTNNSRADIDNIVIRLKRLQAKYGITLIVISSFNRQNYMNEIGFDSFKESGGIEYSADVLWGLQLQAVHSDEFNRGNNNEKRDILNQAKLQAPRKVELVCLKDRFGTPIYNCDFNYYSKHDCFIPEEDDEYDFNEIPDEYLNTLPYNI